MNETMGIEAITVSTMLSFFSSGMTCTVCDMNMIYIKSSISYLVLVGYYYFMCPSFSYRGRLQKSLL